MTRFYFALIFLVGWGAQSLYSQSDQQFDLRSWNAVELDYKLSKRIAFESEVQVRFDKNLSHFDAGLAQFGVSYAITKATNLEYAYRYSVDNDRRGGQQGVSHFGRHQLTGTYEFIYGRWDFQYRLRYQYRTLIYTTKDQLIYPSSDVRFRLKVGYDIPNWKLDPTLSYEIFYHREIGEINGLDQYRWVLGSKKKITKKSHFKFQLGVQVARRVWRPNIDFIVGLGYQYKLG